ncbi:MAG TPA: CapA family protein [Dehalococcoidia bacterium]|nr:CapA family protein [Dehalococcoidia bacterium]
MRRLLPRCPLPAALLIAVCLVACGGHAAEPPVRIILLGSATPSPAAAAGGTPGAVTAPFSIQPTPGAAPTITENGSFKVAATTQVAIALGPALQQLGGEFPKLKLSLTPLQDGQPPDRTGADLALLNVLPGETPPAGATIVQTQPLAIMLPLTLSPDDLTLADAVNLLTGAVTNWSSVGGAARPVTLAFSDPAALARVGALAGKADAQPAAARSDAASTLLAETDRGVDEAAVVPWSGPRLHSKALRIDGRFPDDPGYPLVVQTVALPLHREATQLSAQLGGVLAVRLAPRRDGSVTIDAMGDLMLARGVAAKVQQHGPGWPLGAVSERLRSADLRFANLEFALTNGGTQARKDYTFRAPPAEVDCLTSAGINVIDLANNHVLDYGPQGLIDTLAALDGAGIAHAGAGTDGETAHAPVIVPVNGLRVAWLAYANVPDDSITGFKAQSLAAGPNTPGVAWGTPDAIARDVVNAKQHADLVVVALHSGFEYTPQPNSIQTQLAHTAIDAGAALVLGAHPHVLQGLEFYHGGLIAYSLGNFVFDLDEADLAQYGLPSVLSIILRVRLDASGVTGIEVYPAIINRTGFRPEPVAGAAARPVYDRLYSLTTALAKP